MSLPATILAPDGYTVADAGPELLRLLLSEFEVELTKQHVPVDLLRPGRDFDEVKRAFSAVDRHIPDEVAVWFAWHDGEVADQTRAMAGVLPQFEFYSLDTVLHLIARPRQPYGEEEWDWNREWVHVLGDHKGLIVSCGKDPATPPLVRVLDPTATHHVIASRQSVSLCTPVTWWIEGLRNGWYTWNSEIGRWSRRTMDMGPKYQWFSGLV